jgi:hypothetical protein
MNIYLILYGLIAGALLLGGTAKLYGMGMVVGAVLFFIGSGFLIATYGLRWFVGEKSLLSNAPVKWPPVMNTCPDFLSLYKRKKANGESEDVCVDTIGVSKNSAMLKRFPTSGPVDNEDDTYFFPLKTSKSDEPSRNKEWCQRAILYGLTWEGITNGESCILPDGKKASPSSGSSDSNCPV